MSVWEDIKQKLNILEVIGDYVTIKEMGSSYKCVCPFHQDKNPSLLITPDKGLWHCFGCGEGGDMFKFVMLIENVDLKTALQKLAKKSNTNLQKYQTPTKKLDSDPNLDAKKETKNIDSLTLGYKYLTWSKNIYHQLLLKILQDRNHPVTLYCLNRKLTTEIIQTFEIGYAPLGNLILNLAQKHSLDLELLLQAGLLRSKNKDLENPTSKIENLNDKFQDRLIIPIFDTTGLVTGFTGRVLDYEKNENRPKYLNSPQSDWFNKSKIWFGWHLSSPHIRRQKKALIVEGNMDVITCHQFGLNFCLASQGTSFTGEQIKQLSYATKEIWLAFDNDEAGTISGYKFFKVASSYGIEVLKVVIPKEFKDLDEFLKSDKYTGQTLITKPFLDYILLEKEEELTSVDSKVQRRAISLALDLLTSSDNLTQEQYLLKLKNLTKISLQTLQNILKEQVSLANSFSKEEVNESETQSPVTGQIHSERLVAWQSLVAWQLAQTGFDPIKLIENIYLQDLFKLLQYLITSLESYSSLQEYLETNLEILKIIYLQKPITETQMESYQLNLTNFIDSKLDYILMKDADVVDIYSRLKYKN